ncbi:methyl-accepting chemotaxis protein [Poriferisphaera sp. WC338]|uniref:methyl-accepting chemotaxis protein n=1 Tax=Poriferisphaera sp. WC338 TaxID=3425129 RepID=UPI003D817C6D
MKIKSKLTLMLIACGLLPILVASTVSYWSGRQGLHEISGQGREALSESAYNQLIALRDVKKNQIENYFEARERDMGVLMENVSNMQIEALGRIEQLQATKRAQIEGLFARYRRDAESMGTNGAFLTALEKITEAQHGSWTGKLDANEASYQAFIKEHSGILKSYVQERGYVDAYVLCADHGTLMASVKRSTDWGQNIKEGPLKGEGLGRVWQKVIETGETSVVDFADDTLSGGYAAFIAAPVKNDSGEVVAVAALQISPEMTSSTLAIETKAHDDTVVYLVGSQDGRQALRSDIAAYGDGYHFGRSIGNTYVDAAVKGKAISGLHENESGTLMLVSARHVEVEGLAWALIVERSAESSFMLVLDGAEKDFLAEYNDQYGYYDLFLISPSGQCFYTVCHEADYRTNLVDGKFKNSNLGDLVRQVIATKQFGFADFKPYAPSNYDPAAFIAQPVMQEGQVAFIVALQMPLDIVNDIMGVRAGMGETGETYLIGSDKLMRSDSFLDPEHHTVVASFKDPVKGSVDTDAATAAIKGETDAKIVIDYNGNPVLSAYTPIDVFGERWALLAEIDESEAFAAMNEMEATSASILVSMLTWNAGLALITVVILTVVAIFIAVHVVKIITPIVARAEAIADGDLTGEDLVNGSRDEFGALTSAMNRMSNSLQKLVSTVISSSHEVASASTEIAANSEEIAQGIQLQTQQTTEVSSAVEEVNASINEVANMSADAAQNAETAGARAAEGGEIVNNTINGMKAIATVVADSTDAIGQLGDRSDQIGQIIDVINDIADQTNLLALNAAIEAARAGEHGRGFAVVADEVRKLAERTTTATEEVTESIKAIQSETKTVVNRMGEGNVRVKEGVELAEQAGDTLKAIVDGSQHVADMIKAIAAAAEQQTAASELIGRNIETITSVANESAQGTGQAAVAATQLSDKAEQLQQLVSQFKLEAA